MFVYKINTRRIIAIRKSKQREKEGIAFLLLSGAGVITLICKYIEKHL
jgi:hypothetical protein